MEEAADVLDFMASLANDFDLALPLAESQLYQSDRSFESLYAGLVESCATMIDISRLDQDWCRKEDLPWIFEEELEAFTADFIELISRHGIGITDLEEAYFQKNEVNHQRQNENY